MLPVVTNPVWYAIAIVAGALSGGTVLSLLKPALDQQEASADEEYNVLV